MWHRYDYVWSFWFMGSIRKALTLPLLPFPFLSVLLCLSLSVAQILLSNFIFLGTSLVAQWLRIRLPVQETRVRALVQEDPTWGRATKPMCHNYWACALEPASHNYWAHMLQLWKPTHLELVLHNKRSPHTATKSGPSSPQLEKARAQQLRPNDPTQPKINK